MSSDEIKTGEKTRAIGASEYRRFKAGEELTKSESIIAHCYICMGKYSDGRVDCEMEGECPTYRFMPYANEVEGSTPKPKKIMPKSCARCEFPKCREEGDYSCSLSRPQEDRNGRIFPVNENCWKGRKVRGGKGDV
jgi:hypothetical protein